MEFQELIGTRRSIRFFDPKRPVEQDKIQKILEACLIASCAVNAHWLRAIVVKRVKGARLKQLVEANVVASTHGWSVKFVDEVVYPMILKPMTESPYYPA